MWIFVFFNNYLIQYLLTVSLNKIDKVKEAMPFYSLNDICLKYFK